MKLPKILLLSSVLISAATLITGILELHGQEAKCNEYSIKPIQGIFGFAERKNDLRCEGLYESPIDASFRIVSLLSGTLNFDIEKHSELIVVAPDISELTAESVHIRAVGLPLKTYYRMDAEIMSGNKLRWPIREILYPAKLTAKRIGVFGWTGSESNKYFVPLIVVPTNEDIDAAKSLPIELKLRTEEDIESVIWRTFEENNKNINLPQWKIAAENLDAGEIISLKLNKVKSKILYVHISAKPYNTDEFKIKLKFRIIVTSK
jgi:hypothetical protein